MTKIWQKLALATAGAILSFAVLKANPAQAAIFSFFSERQGDLYGQLFFTDETSGLTGIGTEEASLSQLQSNFFYFKTRSDLSPFRDFAWGTPHLIGSPVLRFESGNLVGLNFSFTPQEATWKNPGQGGGLWVETGELFLQDATYKIKRSLVVKGAYNPFCNPYTFIPYPPYSIYDPEKCRAPELPPITLENYTGKINFVTEVPFKRPTSVPEPGSVVGLSLLGLAFLIKKKKQPHLIAEKVGMSQFTNKGFCNNPTLINRSA